MRDIGRSPTLPPEYELCKCPRCGGFVPFLDYCAECEQWFGPNCYRLHDCKEQEQEPEADPSN